MVPVGSMQPAIASAWCAVPTVAFFLRVLEKLHGIRFDRIHGDSTNIPFQKPKQLGIFRDWIDERGWIPTLPPSSSLASCSALTASAASQLRNRADFFAPAMGFTDFYGMSAREGARR
jgi:hypothetical protein